MLGTHLDYDVHYVHVTHDAVMDFDLSEYDAVFNSYCARHCFDGYVSASYCEALKRFAGPKVIAVQDEYDETDRLKEAIATLGFDVVLTCVPEASLEYVYPKADFPDVEFLTVFTGYVSDALVQSHPNPKPLSERSRFIGYRGRDIGGRYGRLGYDKYEVGARMKLECDARGVSTDIAMDEQSRIYGPAWFDFIEDCRAMLGSESGSNVFDFDGSISREYQKMTLANSGHRPSYEEFEPFVAARERDIEMGQISPRVFECATLRTPMVLFRGRYSDAIEPDTHYIALEKDFSNVDEVLERLSDLKSLEAMTTRAYNHLVASGDYSYAAFYQRVADAIERRQQTLAAGTVKRTVPQAQFVKSTDARDRILAERPSTEPLGMSEYEDKQIQLAHLQLRHAFQGARLSNPSSFTRSPLYHLLTAAKSLVMGSRLLKKIWYLLPQSARFTLANRLHGLVNRLRPSDNTQR